MPTRRPHRLADRLAGVEIVAEIDGIEPCVARPMGGKPASRRHALAVLLCGGVAACRACAATALTVVGHLGGSLPVAISTIRRTGGFGLACTGAHREADDARTPDKDAVLSAARRRLAFGLTDR